jgi:hypothetical protein
MASDDIKKLVSEQMPGFEAVSRPGKSRAAAKPDQQSRPAADWKAKLARGKGDAPASTRRREGAAQVDAPAPAPSRDAFFGSGDPRERLRSRTTARYPDAADSGDDQKTVIVQVRPTDPTSDSGRRGVTPKAVVIKKGKIVGSQG